MVYAYRRKIDMIDADTKAQLNAILVTMKPYIDAGAPFGSWPTDTTPVQVDTTVIDAKTARAAYYNLASLLA
jgi:hypothetical protein